VTPNGTVSISESAIAELVELLKRVKPGQRVRMPTLLREKIHHPEVEAILRNPAALHRLSEENLAVARLVCAGEQPASRDVLIVRRRLSERERLHAVVDVSNVVWTVGTEDFPRVVTALRAGSIRYVTGIADANLPFALGENRLRLVREACDRFVTVPGGVPADRVILDTVQEQPAIIVSGDTFRDWRRTSPWRRRNIWRLRVPVIHTIGQEGSREFSFSDVGLELRLHPLIDAERLS
jgi:hypothetical protein